MKLGRIVRSAREGLPDLHYQNFRLEALKRARAELDAIEAEVIRGRSAENDQALRDATARAIAFLIEIDVFAFPDGEE